MKATIDTATGEIILSERLDALKDTAIKKLINLAAHLENKCQRQIVTNLERPDDEG